MLEGSPVYLDARKHFLCFQKYSALFSVFSFCLFEFGRITNILCRRLCNFFSLAFDFFVRVFSFLLFASYFSFSFFFFSKFYAILLLFLAFLWLLVMNHDLFVLFSRRIFSLFAVRRSLFLLLLCHKPSLVFRRAATKMA